MKNLKKSVTLSIIDYYKSSRVVESLILLSRQEGLENLDIRIFDNSCSEQNFNVLRAVAEGYENVFLSRGRKNIGYVEATKSTLFNNRNNYILLLNPDILVRDEYLISRAIDILENLPKNTGILGVRQINDDGSHGPVYRRFPNLLTQILRRTPLRALPAFKQMVNQYEARDKFPDQEHQVDWLQSSFWLLRKSVWDEIGGLDNRFFLFMADTDFCLRLKKKGYSCHYTCRLTVFADGVRASGGDWNPLRNKVLRIHFFDALKYYIKNLMTFGKC